MARRFAVWALASETQMTHGEIGGYVGMSAPHVAVVLRRLGRSPGGALQAWVDAWSSRAASEGTGL